MIGRTRIIYVFSCFVTYSILSTNCFFWFLFQIWVLLDDKWYQIKAEQEKINDDWNIKPKYRNTLNEILLFDCPLQHGVEHSHFLTRNYLLQMTVWGFSRQSQYFYKCFSQCHWQWCVHTIDSWSSGYVINLWDLLLNSWHRQELLFSRSFSFISPITFFTSLIAATDLNTIEKSYLSYAFILLCFSLCCNNVMRIAFSLFSFFQK
jgi:hypothetical protein